MDHQNKSFIIHLREKCFKQKNNDHELPANVCFKTFSVKRKENDLDKKYRILGGIAEIAPSPTISQI